MEARAQLCPWSKDVDIALFSAGKSATSCVVDLVTEDIPAGAILRPAFSLEAKAVQRLMDDLWNCGYRPSDGVGSAGQLSAVQKHLEDMRTLVFNRRCSCEKE